MQWDDCYVCKNFGDLSLIDHEDALHALQRKWITKAFAPGCSIIQMPKAKPGCKGAWPPASQWVHGHKFQAVEGSWGWNCIAQTWWHLLQRLETIPSINRDEVLNNSLWYTTHFIGFCFGISPQDANSIVQEGPPNYQEHLEPRWRAVQNMAELFIQFQLLPQDHTRLFQLIEEIPQQWIQLLIIHQHYTKPSHNYRPALHQA